MFKLESYIAPILLSYVDKYIKNFKLEDSQVSLWGGDASFQNLDLNLEVLEQELQSPFSFISGHIRELLIHVPWTKLTSEPITITINTIECVLKIKEAGSPTHSDSPSQSKDKKQNKKHAGNRQEIEAPPNYIQLLINKIVSNIRIYCNNLILKYVEEDIVLSMNVKHFKFESCNEKWETAYADLSPIQVVMRKIIGVNDLTICLDKRNASGKIDVYQEPMLYRCSMTMHLLRTYHSSTANKSSLTKLDIYCNSMEFSMTEQQVPMFLRLLLLLYALQQRQLKSNTDFQDGMASPTDQKDGSENSESWTGWAWSYVSSVLPTQWDEDIDQQEFVNQSGHIVQIGFYVDNASLTFKVSESSNDKGYYNQKKIRYCPLLTFQLQGIYSELLFLGATWFNSTCGVSEARLLPVGPCSCAYLEAVEDPINSPYLQIGCTTNSHKSDSLFDAQAAENKGERRIYNTNWDFHMTANTETVLLERTPAFVCDYLYQMEIPSDITSEMLSELGSNYEYSNIPERSSLRICFGPVRFKMCSGLYHRLKSLEVAASSYDYSPYYILKPDPSLVELLPASEEDFDALNEFIPTRSVKIMLFEPTIELQLMDHPYFEPTKGFLIKRSKKRSSTSQLQKLPKVTIECRLIEVSFLNPMYVKRLVQTTCQLPEPPIAMFDACYSQVEINVIGLSSRLILKPTNQTTIVVPFNLTFQSKNILKPLYWVNPDIPHNQVVFEIENLTVNGTKAKMMVVAHIIESLMARHSDDLKNITCTSLLFDAAKDYGMPYLELYIEGVKFKKVVTNTTMCLDASLGSIKAFIFESLDSFNGAASEHCCSDYSSNNDIQQVLFLSGPDSKVATESKFSSTPQEEPLFNITIQYPLNPEVQKHAPLLIFNLQEIKICVDPLLCKWMLYYPIEINVPKVEHSLEQLVKGKSFSETYGTATVSETSRKISGAHIESVHSSSDRELLQFSYQKRIKTTDEESIDVQEKIYSFLKKWYSVWKGMLFSGNISQCTIYFPTCSISAVGSRGVGEAIKEATNKGTLANVMVITLPFAVIQSAQKQNILKHLKRLPVKLPDKIWTLESSSFPWTMSISDLNCYTIQSGKKFVFLKPVSLSATVGLSTKPADSEVNNSMGHLGVYVHIDMTPIAISLTESQMYLFASILYGLAEAFAHLMPPKVTEIELKTSENLPAIIPANSPSLSPTVRDTTLDNTSENTLPVSETNKSEVESNESVKLTAWIQWTITKFSLELLTDDLVNQNEGSSRKQLKLVVDIEDIVSSLDYQNVYLKLKSKIGSISIQHFKRNFGKNKWHPGPFSGVIMRLREDVATEKRPEEGGFVSITITRASSQHTHNLWGTIQQKSKKDEKRLLLPQLQTSRYITEIVINVQPIDFVVPIRTLMNFYAIVAPLLDIPSQHEERKEIPKKKSVQHFTNQTLPLAYLECQDIRVIVPSSELAKSGHHDVYVLQIAKIALSPAVVNPICRTPIRPDIYKQAAQARILTIPGSELEDRQYQLDVIGMSLSTGTWEDLDHVLNMRNQSLAVNENPALEWNKLESGQLSVIPILNLKPVAEKFDISVVAAPAMVYKNDIVVCGNSVEVNFVTDIALQLSLDQIKLAAALNNELSTSSDKNSQIIKRHEVTFPYSRFDKYSNLNSDMEIELTEFYKDSGIDTSEIHSVLSSKSQALPGSAKIRKALHKVSTTVVGPNNYSPIPSEVLFTAGKISCSLYQVVVSQSAQTLRKKGKKSHVKDEDKSYEASEDESVDEVNRTHRKYVPLMYLQTSQPNAYFSSQHFSQRAQITCFDILAKMNGPDREPLSTIPTCQDFPVSLLETRAGNAHPVTGIPPAFLTLKYNKDAGKSASYTAEISRPTKIALSTYKLSYLMALQAKILDNFPKKTELTKSSSTTSMTQFEQLKERLRGVDSFQIKTDQLVFVIETDSHFEANLTFGKIKSRLYYSDRPEKVCSSTKFSCVTFAVSKEQLAKILLNPWTVEIEVCAYQEPWQNGDGDPRIHVAINSDCIYLDVSPAQIRCVETVIKEMTDFASSLKLTATEAPPTPPNNQDKPISDKDQHYKDDLRAGAFQFIDATNSGGSDELPLPYQVMFWNTCEVSAMAWRYPHPRALTKVRVFPVPFEISSDSHDYNRILCHLQYWSDYQNSYVPYVQFYLSESEVCYLNLPKSDPQKAVACVWRVVLSTIDRHGWERDRSSISPRALAACMRIDSYFNKSLIPNVTSVLYVTKIEMSLNTNLSDDVVTYALPKCLQGLKCDSSLPESHCFFKLGWENFRLNLASWQQNEMLAIDVSAVTKCSILDYTYLVERILFEPFSSKLEMSLSKKLSCSFVSNQIQLRFGPTIAHTLSVNSQIWTQDLSNSPKEDRDFIIFTRYVIRNDTDVNLRFAQVLTDEDILLPSENFHLYCWRSRKQSRRLKVALEEKSWIWSKAFHVDEDGTQVVQISSDSNLSLIVEVRSLSATQRQITFSGQFVIANMLLEHFEFKVVGDSKEDLRKNTESHILAGKTVTPSMFIDYRAKYFLRLRFCGLEAAWTGDIPLKEHTKGAQPWLVKVPLQERGQFLSIWCRIVVQDFAKGRKILAMLWPLFTVKSNLPMMSKIHIETPSLNVHLDSVAGGKGELEQLYCPGTIDHSHQLTFKLNDGTSISDPYIPLNYSLVDQQQFFKRADKEDIADILESLRDFKCNDDSSKWPYFGEDFSDVTWIVDEQPQTTVQVRYKNACDYSSALLVELLPWCLLVNTFGCPISLMANGIELCKLSQYGIVAPPKLDENFHLGVDTGRCWSYSGPLQLAKSDWSQTFYMPKIMGTLPLEGNMKISVRCASNVCMVNMSSSISNEIRLLRVSSTHVFSNKLVTQVQVVCFAVPDSEEIYDIPSDVEDFAFSVAPHADKSNSGISIIRWFGIDVDNEENEENCDYSLYVSFSLDKTWCCPIQVDRAPMRRSVAVTLKEESIPLVLTSQEYKGQIYLSLFHDDRPQILLENKSDIPLYCGQSVGDGNAVAEEAKHFKWYNKIASGTKVYYTMPFVSEKFPELPQTCFSEKIVFACEPKNDEEFEWSSCTSLTSDMEQFVRIPSCGDIKLVVKATAYATLVTIEPVSQVEISAIDIRGRLSMHELATNEIAPNVKKDQSDVASRIRVDSNMERPCTIEPSPSDNDMSYRALFVPTLPANPRWKCVELFVFIKSFGVIFSWDHELVAETSEDVAGFTFDNIGCEVCQNKRLQVKLTVTDVQFDNLCYMKESYDFPVVLVSQSEERKFRKIGDVLSVPAEQLVDEALREALICFELTLETWRDSLRNTSVTGVKDARVTVNPLSCYVEDLYIFRLAEYFKMLLPVNQQKTMKPSKDKKLASSSSSDYVRVPEFVTWQSALTAHPLNLRNVTVEPLNVLLSVHCSLKMYIALDQSPLQFGRFERRRLLTTPYRLGHAMTMHYLSGAIFGAGWVVSSLELLGSPGGLARAMGTGLKDFVSLPYRGLVQGPWAFLIGVTHGSASLMKHVTAGTLQSVTKLASSVARNLDRLTLDDEHLRRTEEQRRQKPQGLTQGFMLGLTGLGISLLGAVGGIAHHPLQSLMADGASPRSLAAGVGLGLVGVFTKPLSGAAELVALTGQGLLQGAGWNPLPQPRLVHSIATQSSTSSALKYEWKVIKTLSRKLLFVTEATAVLSSTRFEANALILTSDALIVVDTEDDVVKRIVSLSQLQAVKSDVDPTLLSIKIMNPVMPLSVKVEDDLVVEMDPACRARVADYVRSTASLLQMPSDSSVQDGALNLDEILPGECSEILTYYVNPLNRNYFVCLLYVAKQQSHNNYNFPVL